MIVSPEYSVVTSDDDLQKARAVRSIVFIEGQNISYSDEMDGLDSVATHFLGTINGEPVATARMRVLENYIKVERLAVRNAYRGRGIGKEMFAFVLRYIFDLRATMNLELSIKIHAQSYLIKFYEEFGFVKHGEKFFEANIEHYCMILE